MPPHNFFEEGIEIRERGSVIELGEPIGSNHPVQFFLSFTLDIRVHRHGEEEGLQRVVSLGTWNKIVRHYSSARKTERLTVSEPAKTSQHHDEQAWLLNKLDLPLYIVMAKCLMNVSTSCSPPPSRSYEVASSSRRDTNESFPTPVCFDHVHQLRSASLPQRDVTHQTIHCTLIEFVE